MVTQPKLDSPMQASEPYRFRADSIRATMAENPGMTVVTETYNWFTEKYRTALLDPTGFRREESVPGFPEAIRVTTWVGVFDENGEGVTGPTTVKIERKSDG